MAKKKKKNKPAADKKTEAKSEKKPKKEAEKKADSEAAKVAKGNFRFGNFAAVRRAPDDAEPGDKKVLQSLAEQTRTPQVPWLVAAALVAAVIIVGMLTLSS